MQNLADEIADLWITSEQIVLLFDLEKLVKEKKQFKLERLNNRLEHAEKHLDN